MLYQLPRQVYRYQGCSSILGRSSSIVPHFRLWWPGEGTQIPRVRIRDAGRNAGNNSGRCKETSEFGGVSVDSIAPAQWDPYPLGKASSGGSTVRALRVSPTCFTGEGLTRPGSVVQAKAVTSGQQSGLLGRSPVTSIPLANATFCCAPTAVLQPTRLPNTLRGCCRAPVR